jgi:hypothetical protein
MGVRSSAHSTVRRPAVAVAAATVLALMVLASADTSTLGAPDAWPWLLTGLQVLALWSAGRHYWWGWLLGGAVQLPWIAYALVTGQVGFIPGCVVSASVQFYTAIRHSESERPMEAA